MTSSFYAKAIEDHYIKFWSEPLDRIRWPFGRMDVLPAEFHVSTFRKDDEVICCSTVAMSQPDDVEAIETFMFAKFGAPHRNTIVEILTAVASYHRADSVLGWGHTVNFGKPLCSGSVCDHGLLSLPYIGGPDLEWMDVPRVRFLWLIPVTRQEVLFKKKEGLEALERIFENKRIDYLDPMRRSLV